MPKPTQLGYHAQELGRLDEAEASYTQAIALKPDYAEAHYNLGNTLKELGRLDEPEALAISKRSRFKPDYAEAFYNYGLSPHLLRGSLEKGFNFYESRLRKRNRLLLLLEPTLSGMVKRA